MALIISDLERKYINCSPEDSIITPENGEITPCCGCFCCWLKTPGVCVCKDNYSSTGHLMSECGELVIISKLTFGSLSPFVKNVFDRAISFVHPFFRTYHGQMHHRMRYHVSLPIRAYLYGDASDGYLPDEEEYETALNLLCANAENIGGEFLGCEYFSSPEKIKSLEIHHAKENL